MAKIDIIMPCYNAERYIEKTIQSVLTQTEQDFRLICIDDCSSDNTYNVLLQLAKDNQKILVLKNEINCGIAATRNRGIEESDAEYIAFLDNDDIMPSNRLQIGKEYLEKNQAIGIVGGNYLVFNNEGEKKVAQENGFYSSNQVRAILPFVNIIPNGTTLIRRNIIQKNGILFHEKYGVEDYWFYSEMSQVTDINMLPDVMLEHRVMETQYSSVCTMSEVLYEKRQNALDDIHRMLISNITDFVSEDDIRIYLRFAREKAINIKISEIIQLRKAIKRIQKAVFAKNNAEYQQFCEFSNQWVRWNIKRYICQIIMKKN